MAEPQWDGAADLAWSRAVSELAVDALVRANIVPSTDFERATAIVAEEIYVRLAIQDRPWAGSYTLRRCEASTREWTKVHAIPISPCPSILGLDAVFSLCFPERQES